MNELHPEFQNEGEHRSAEDKGLGHEWQNLSFQQKLRELKGSGSQETIEDGLELREGRRPSDTLGDQNPPYNPPDAGRAEGTFRLARAAMLDRRVNSDLSFIRPDRIIGDQIGADEYAPPDRESALERLGEARGAIAGRNPFPERTLLPGLALLDSPPDLELSAGEATQDSFNRARQSILSRNRSLSVSG